MSSRAALLDKRFTKSIQKRSESEVINNSEVTVIDKVSETIPI